MINGRNGQGLERRVSGSKATVSRSGLRPRHNPDAPAIILRTVEKTGGLDILIHGWANATGRGTEAMEPHEFAALLNTT